MKKFKVGDLVALKSGGPKMTVKGEDTSGEIICQWFDGPKVVTGTFEEETLKKDDGPGVYLG